VILATLKALPTNLNTMAGYYMKGGIPPGVKKRINETGFVNILIVVVVLVVLAGVVGYLILVKKLPESSNLTPQQNTNNVNAVTPLTTANTTPADNTVSQNDIESFVASLCNKEKFPVHITKGKYFESGGAVNQFFVYCEIPQNIPIPSLYLIEQRKPEGGGFQVRWSKLLDFSSGLRSIDKPEIFDVDKDGLSEIYWGGTTWGGTCAPHATFGFLLTGKHDEEFSIMRSYEFDAKCESSSILKETKFTPDPLSRDPQYTKPFYDYLKTKVPVEK
jgi:biopolymer transport protein ExbD